MSTALRDLLWSTKPLHVHYTGHTTAETGGTTRPVQYDDDAPFPANITSITASVAIARLAHPEGVPMRRRIPVYDEHTLALRGGPGPTLDEQERREALRDVAVNAAAGIVVCAVLLAIVTAIIKCGWPL